MSQQQPLTKLKSLERLAIDVDIPSISPIFERLRRNDLAKQMLKSPYYAADSPPRRRVVEERKIVKKKKRVVSPTPYSVDCISSNNTNLSEIPKSKPKPIPVANKKKRVRFSKRPRTNGKTVQEYVPDHVIPAKLRELSRHVVRLVPETSPVRSRRTGDVKTRRGEERERRIPPHHPPNNKPMMKKKKHPLKQSRQIHIAAETLLDPVFRNKGDSAVSSHFGERLRALRVSVKEESDEKMGSFMMKSQHSRGSIRSIRTESSVSSAAERLRKAQQRAFETRRLCVDFLREAKAYIRPLYSKVSKEE